MKISTEFLVAPDQSCHRIAVMRTTRAELEAHQRQLEELGIPSLVYDSGDEEFDKVLVTPFGDFMVVYDEGDSL